MNFDREYKCRIYRKEIGCELNIFDMSSLEKYYPDHLYTTTHCSSSGPGLHLYLIFVHDEWHYICDLRPVAFRRALFELFHFLRGNWPKSTSHRPYRGGYHHDETRSLLVLQVAAKHHISQCLFMCSDKWSLLENCLSHR